ncbi:hypothetical protein SDJN03_01215, partial [Cucurbita argyrosperma subsp. sororia]
MVDFKKMAVTKDSILVSLLMLLCLSHSSANRVLKDNDSENESINNSVSFGQEYELHNFIHAELNNIVPEGSIPKFRSYRDCCNHGNHGGGYVCPPNHACGRNSGCRPYYSCSPCQWWRYPVLPPPCGCAVGKSYSMVQESIQTSEADLDGNVPAVEPANHNIKFSGGANQNMKSNGGLV